MPISRESAGTPEHVPVASSAEHEHAAAAPAIQVTGPSSTFDTAHDVSNDAELVPCYPASSRISPPDPVGIHEPAPRLSYAASIRDREQFMASQPGTIGTTEDSASAPRTPSSSSAQSNRLSSRPQAQWQSRTRSQRASPTLVQQASWEAEEPPRKLVDTNDAGTVQRLLAYFLPGGPNEPLAEPRRSIVKRPDERNLGERDPYSIKRIAEGTSEPIRSGAIVRAVPFAAPYARSGVVLDQPPSLRDWIPAGPFRFPTYQWLYVFVGHSLIAAVISGSINFGVAVARFRTAPTVDLWHLNRNTVLGGLGVTVLIQQVVTFLITSSLAHGDIAKGPIGPLRRPWPPLLHLPSTPSPQGHWLGTKLKSQVEQDGIPCRMGPKIPERGASAFKSWMWWFVRAVLTGSERNDVFGAGLSWRQRVERVLWTAVQGFFLGCLSFPLFWGVSVAIMAPIYGNRDFANNGTWIPIIATLLFGALLGMLTNPFFALMALGAESNVRRCYPELDMWKPFGGDHDTMEFRRTYNVRETGMLRQPIVNGQRDLEK